MKYLIYFFVIFLFFYFFINVNAATLNSCTIRQNSCSASEISLFKVDNTENAHSELNSQTNYNYFVCCDGLNLISTNINPYSFNILNLSDPTNAHVAYDTSYNQNPVYLGNNDNQYVNCRYDTNCNPTSNERCVVTVSSPNNAHVADCLSPNAYPTKICCSISSSPPVTSQCKLIQAYWAPDIISPAYPNGYQVLNNSKVTQVLNGTYCSNSDKVNFSIWENDCSNPNDKNQISINSNGVPSCFSGNINFRSSFVTNFVNNVSALTWDTRYEVDSDGANVIDSIDYPEFYFVAHLLTTTNSNLSQMIIVNKTNDPINPPGDGGISTCGNGIWNQEIERCDSSATITGNTGCPGTCSINCDSCTVIGQGVKTITTRTPCKDDGDGDRFGIYTETTTNYNLTTGIIISTSTSAPKQCLIVSSLRVPFFSWINFVMVILLLIIFYTIKHKRKNQVKRK